MPRAQRVALGIQVFVVVAASLYWALWYGGGRALIANQASDTYVAFQNAFLLADCWLVGVCALGAWAILARRPTWSLWVMLGASSSVFLGLMDVCFNFENGIYASARGPALALEVLLNALALGFGVWGAQLGWRACASASNTQRLTGSTHSQ